MPTPPETLTVDEHFDRLETVPGIDADAYGAGIFRRRMRLINISPDRTIGELEDDFHHFRVEIIHDGTTIIEANGMGMRGPWSSCFGADEPLRAIEGHSLSSRSTAIGTYTAPTSNCTHLFDLTGLTVAHSVRDAETRQYDIAVTDTVEGRSRLTLWRDGDLVLDWHLTDGEIAEPADWVGAPLHRKFIPWAEEQLDPDLAEAAIALRRVVHISMGRTMDLDDMPNAAAQGIHMHGRCHTYSTEVAITGLREKGSPRDFTEAADAALLLSDMHLR